MVTKDEGRQAVKKLIATFRDNIAQYTQMNYKEAQARKEFIDKFFVTLGWDVNNDQGFAEQYKEVINEDSLKIGGNTKAPDYAFRIGTTRIFFAEAKKPHINIKDDPEPALQLRRYAWNAKIPVSILTSFRELAVYDCRIKPNPHDSSSVARLQYFYFEEYDSKFDIIWDIFSKEAVLRGSFDRYVDSSKGKRGTSEVDSEFLKEIEGWRELLAKNIALRNPNLSISEMNYAVQRTIDRILFLRIAEDRNIEPYETLKNISLENNIYKKLMILFQNADDKYNSGIFDLAADVITSSIGIDDKILEKIITDLYYPVSPYDFAVLKIEILGSVYERFLGSTIRLTAAHLAKVEEKPEVRKAGGVYYTPEFVVDYIVRNTVGKVIKGKTPKEIEKLRVLDPACGSGTFLVRAYTYLLEYHLNYYLTDKEKYKKRLYQIKENVWNLTTEVRKKILTNNIFGVDIDPQAVELAKLSLLLKVLENETKESINQQLKLFNERALPNLDNNIKCGNSIVDYSYFKQSKIDKNMDDLSKVNPFDWNDEAKGFGKILTDGGFDVIIGNPPYVKEYTNKGIFEDVKETNLKKYYQGKMDIWYLFTCNAVDLLKENGLHSFIAQNNWITSAGASILRNKVLNETELISFFDFNDFKVFKDASIQTMIFVLRKKRPKTNYVIDYNRITNADITKNQLENYLLNKKCEGIEHIKVKIRPKELINKTISFVDSGIGEVLQSMENKSNYKFREENIATGIDVHQDFVTDKHLELLKTENIIKGEGIFVLTNEEVDKLKLTPKEKQIIKPYYTTEELDQYYGNHKNKLWIIYSDIKVRKNIVQYPNIKEHFERFKKVITSDFAPYGLHRAREQRFFEGEKIMSLRKTPKPRFTYTDFPCYVSQSYFVIKPNKINLKYLTGLLNSKIVYFWLKYRGKKQGEQLQIDKKPLLDIPLYNPNGSDKNKEKIYVDIISDVESIIQLNMRLETIRLESEINIIKRQIDVLKDKIDEQVYELYNINAAQKQIIENAVN